MPTRYVNKYMIVKTDKGYINVDKDGNKFSINKTKKKRKTKKNKKNGNIKKSMKFIFTKFSTNAGAGKSDFPYSSWKS